MSRYVLQKRGGDLDGSVLTESGDSFSHDPRSWWLFESATEAALYSFGLPFPVEVVIVGAAVAGELQPCTRVAVR